MPKDMVLVVDDVETERKALCALLTDDYDVVEARDGAQALTLLARMREEIRIVVLDTLMPQIDGFAVLRKMTEGGLLYDIPVIVATADSAPETEALILELGAVDVLHKPYNPIIAKRRIANELRRQETERLRRHLLIKEETRHRDKLLNQLDAFKFELDHSDGSVYLDPYYRMHLKNDWSEFRFDNPECVRRFTYRPDYPRFAELLKQASENEFATADVRFMARSGVYEWFRLGLTIQTSEGGHSKRTVLTFGSINEEVEARNKLEMLARNVPLTQLPNLSAFVEETALMLEGAQDTEHVMIRLDLERFRLINQLYGNAEGDNVLRYFAVKLQECVESGYCGTYGHISSDVFAVCMPNVEADVNGLIDTLQAAMAAYPLRFELIIAFGLYVVDDRRISVNDMLNRATAAQRTVKGSYSRHVGVYDDLLRKKDEAERTILLEMREALEGGQFVPYLQPKCDIATGRIVGSEVLARWVHPDKGMISPTEFIPIFEKNGFINELDRFMLEKTCAMIRAWCDEHLPVLPVSINLSRADLYNPLLLESILQTAQAYDVPHGALEFELTESSFVSDTAKLIRLTEALQAEGFRVLMDDFGSGYSSLNSLKDIRVDVLKIDMKFLSFTDGDERAKEILRSVVSMARALELDIIAEGVENEEQAVFLRGIGVSTAQGYHFFRPMPVDDFLKLIPTGA